MTETQVSETWNTKPGYQNTGYSKPEYPKLGYLELGFSKPVRQITTSSLVFTYTDCAAAYQTRLQICLITRVQHSNWRLRHHDLTHVGQSNAFVSIVRLSDLSKPYRPFSDSNVIQSLAAMCVCFIRWIGEPEWDCLLVYYKNLAMPFQWNCRLQYIF